MPELFHLKMPVVKLRSPFCKVIHNQVVRNFSSVLANVLLPSSSLHNLGVTLAADKRQMQNLKAQARNLEAALGVL